MTDVQKTNEHFLRRVGGGESQRLCLDLWKYLDITLEREQIAWRIFDISVEVEDINLVIKYTVSEILGYFRTIEDAFRLPMPEIAILGMPLPWRLFHEIKYKIWAADRGISR